MIRTQEATGKTVDEARAKACALLGVQADDLNVSYEVLEMPQKTGFLGLKTTPAKVRVSVEEPDAPAAPVVEEKVEPEVKPVVEEAPAEEPKAEEPAAAPVAEEAAPAEETADPAAEGEEPEVPINIEENAKVKACLLYTSPSAASVPFLLPFPQPASIVTAIVAHISALTNFFFIFLPPVKMKLN